MKEILTKIGDWNIVKVLYPDEDTGEIEIYAEHRVGCTGRPDKFISEWEWEWDDGVTECYVCHKEVPEKVRGIVMLANFDKGGGRSIRGGGHL